MIIVIVEDNKAIRELIKIQLKYELRDYTVKEFSRVEDIAGSVINLDPVNTYWIIDGELAGKLTGIDLIKILKGYDAKYLANIYFTGNYPEMQEQARNLGITCIDKNLVAKTIAVKIKENKK